MAILETLINVALLLLPDSTIEYYFFLFPMNLFMIIMEYIFLQIEKVKIIPDIPYLLPKSYAKLPNERPGQQTTLTKWIVKLVAIFCVTFPTELKLIGIIR